MDSEELKEHMKNMDTAHHPKDVPPPNENPPDGTYPSIITGAVFKEKKDGSSLMLILNFRVLGEECKGWTYDKFHSRLQEFVADTWVPNLDKLDRLAQDLQILKSCPDNWADLANPETLDALVGLSVLVELKTVEFIDEKTSKTSEFQFINLLELITSDGGAITPNAANDDIPF